MPIAADPQRAHQIMGEERIALGHLIDDVQGLRLSHTVVQELRTQLAQLLEREWPNVRSMGCSTAPNAMSEACCAAVIPVSPLISMRS